MQCNIFYIMLPLQMSISHKSVENLTDINTKIIYNILVHS